MHEAAIIHQFTPATSPKASREGNRVKSRVSKKRLLHHAVDLEELTHKAATGMRESIEDDSPKSRATIRADRQALAAIVKAWDTAIDRIRKLKGIPDPGSLKHDTVQAGKPKKTKPANRPPSFKQAPTQVPAAEVVQSHKPDEPPDNPA